MTNANPGAYEAPEAPAIGARVPRMKCDGCGDYQTVVVQDVERKPNGSLKVYVECTACKSFGMYRIGL
jgi:DNA-directed RNA polymerase subunit M/transcription elongation factor TFIIS